MTITTTPIPATTLDHLACAAEALTELARLTAMEEEPEAREFLAVARAAVADAADEAAYEAADFAHAVACWNLDNAFTAAEAAAHDAEEQSEDSEELAEELAGELDIADEAYSVAREAYNATNAILTTLHTAREQARLATQLALPFATAALAAAVVAACSEPVAA
jgi:hypothetical protein